MRGNLIAALTADGEAAYRLKFRDETKQLVLQLILDLCAMGRVEPETKNTKEQVIQCLELGFCK